VRIIGNVAGPTHARTYLSEFCHFYNVRDFTLAFIRRICFALVLIRCATSCYVRGFHVGVLGE
jgi:hypothetical protein